MALYKIRNKRRQVVAEVSGENLSVHDQKLSWQLQRLREQKEPPFSLAEASGEGHAQLGDLLRFLAASDYTIEPIEVIADQQRIRK